MCCETTAPEVIRRIPSGAIVVPVFLLFNLSPLGKQGSGILVDNNIDLVVELEDGSGAGRVDVAFKHCLDCVCLCLAVCNQQYASCIEDGADTHGHCLGGDVINLCEETGVCLDGFVCKVDLMCTHDEAVGRLIETDVTVSADAEKLEIDSAGSCDSRIVFLTFNLNVLCEAVRDMGVFLFDVDAVEEIVLHEITVALVVFVR